MAINKDKKTPYMMTENGKLINVKWQNFPPTAEEHAKQIIDFLICCIEKAKDDANVMYLGEDTEIDPRLIAEEVIKHFEGTKAKVEKVAITTMSDGWFIVLGKNLT